jgi:hypothetical protein
MPQIEYGEARFGTARKRGAAVLTENQDISIT